MYRGCEECYTVKVLAECRVIRSQRVFVYVEVRSKHNADCQDHEELRLTDSLDHVEFVVFPQKVIRCGCGVVYVRRLLKAQRV